MSIQDTIKQAVRNISGPTRLSELPGDYDEISLAVAGVGGSGGMGDKIDFKIGNRIFESGSEVKNALQGNKIPAELQKKLGQDPSDTNIDDFDDVLKVTGLKNVSIVPEKFKKTTHPVTSPKNDTMNTDDLKEKVFSKKGLAVAAAGVGLFLVMR